MILKRVADILVSSAVLIVASPLLAVVCFLVWIQDFRSPFYIAPRVARGGAMFKMVKLRSMVVNADKTQVDSTGANDKRITPIGHFIRRYKLDELMQLWNVLKGEMSLVGPRPNVKRATDFYTAEEKRLLTVSPGITDISSIVFSDEGDILKDEADPDLSYEQLIRPWKSRLGLLYIDHRSLALDLHLMVLTLIAVVDRQKALKGVNGILVRLGAPEDVIRVALRDEKLVPHPPPGTDVIVQVRDQVLPPPGGSDTSAPTEARHSAPTGPKAVPDAVAVDPQVAVETK